MTIYEEYEEHKKEVFKMVFDSLEKSTGKRPSVFNDGERELIYIRGGEGTLIYYPSKHDYLEGYRASFEAFSEGEVINYLANHTRYHIVR
jgi:hypothetical protein